MQGDIFQLDQMQIHQLHEPKHTRYEVAQQKTNWKPQHSHAATDYSSETSMVAVYNEDDLSHFLYLKPLPNIDTQDYQQSITPVAPVFPRIQEPLHSSPVLLATTGTLDSSPCLSSEDIDSDSCAVFTDDEDEGVDNLDQPAHHPIVHHVITSALDGFGRHAGHPDDTADFTGGGALRRHPARTIQHSSRAFSETELHASKTNQRKGSGTQSLSCVSFMEDSLMNWWPAPMDMLEHEWQEKFYE